MPIKKKKTIAVVSGSRAEFGLLEPIMRAIDAHPRLRLRLIMAGAHLVTGTWRDALRSDFEIAARVPMQKRNQTDRTADVIAVGRGLPKFAQVFKEMLPDAVLVLGDRIEAFAAASAASIGGYVLGHIHGGDRAEGIADEAMRHAISKMAHLHFPATARSQARLRRMGERWDRVYRVGSPAIDGLSDVWPAEDAPDVIVMQHPIGVSEPMEHHYMKGTLGATRKYNRLVMMPNRDAGQEGIVRAIKEAGVDAVEHLPRHRWLSLLAGAKVIVGNSSTGLIEAAALKTACVNIGPRQAGREKPGNVVDTAYGKLSVSRAIDKALKLDLRRLRHPYGKGNAGQQIAQILAKTRLDTMSRRKHNVY